MSGLFEQFSSDSKKLQFVGLAVVAIVVVIIVISAVK